MLEELYHYTVIWMYLVLLKKKITFAKFTRWMDAHRLRRRGDKIREAMNSKLQNGKTQAPSKIAGANFSVITLSKLKSAVYFKGMCQMPISFSFLYFGKYPPLTNEEKNYILIR